MHRLTLRIVRIPAALRDEGRPDTRNKDGTTPQDVHAQYASQGSVFSLINLEGRVSPSIWNLRIIIDRYSSIQSRFDLGAGVTSAY